MLPPPKSGDVRRPPGPTAIVPWLPTGPLAEPSTLSVASVATQMPPPALTTLPAPSVSVPSSTNVAPVVAAFASVTAPKPTFRRSPEPLTVPVTVMSPRPPMPEEPAERATLPLQLAAVPLLFTSATPKSTASAVVPSIESVSSTTAWPLRSRVPPEKRGELRVVPAAAVPSAWALPIFSVPPVICVTPL